LNVLHVQLPPLRERSATPLKACAIELGRAAGSQFDPVVLTAFRQVFGSL